MAVTFKPVAARRILARNVSHRVIEISINRMNDIASASFIATSI